MLIIKFTIRGSKITWFVNDNWVMCLSFLLTMLMGIFYRNRRIRNQHEKIKMANPTGGKLLDECIDHDSIYEVVDPALEIVIKRMLKLPPEAGPVVISVPLFILSYIVSRQPIKQITILGVSILTDKFTTLAIKTGVGILGGSIFFFNPVGIVSLTGAIVTTALILNIAQGIDNVKCNNLVSKLPMERVSSEKTIGFLEELPEKTPKIFIKGSEDTDLYIPSSDTDGDCSSEYKPVEVKKLNRNKVETKPKHRIRRKCEKEYVPLKERTKTLADLKKEDSTENREKAAPFIKRYEDRRRRIMTKRTEL